MIILSSSVKVDGTGSSGKKSKSRISSSVESGQRSTADDYKEEDDDLDYTYSNYKVKVKQALSDRFGYDLSSFTYTKDYDSSDALDNRSQIIKTNWFYYLSKQKQRSFKFGIKIQYKEKSFYDSPDREFTQLMVLPSLKFKKEDIYSVKLSTGFNKYDYLTADQKNQLKYSAKLDGYRFFSKKKLKLSGYYRIEHLNNTQTGRDRTKHNIMSGIDYVFDNNFIYKIKTKAKWGKRDTKEEEDRDDDSDYEYRKYKVMTVHKISKKLKTNLKYDYFIKDYKVTDLDHKGFYFVNGYDYEILKDKAQRSWLNFDFGRKDTRYIEKTGKDYRKVTADIKLNYNRKKNWKTSFGIESSFYKYDNEQNDKKRYYAKWNVEKLFINGELNVDLGLKYRFTDKKHELDDEQEAVRVGLSYKF